MGHVCRICLDTKPSELFYPCRCKTPVHPECLQRWRTAGLNVANLTRCEVCDYHYRLDGAAPWKVHLIIYGLALLQTILFLLIAMGVGQAVRSAGLVDAVAWGRLTVMKPETAYGFFFLGLCFNCFSIGLLSTIYLLVKVVRKRCSGQVRKPSRVSEWSKDARQGRNGSKDCCRDCCYVYDAYDNTCCMSFYLAGPDCRCFCCELCCGFCDRDCDCTTECCKSGSGCKSRGGGGCCDQKCFDLNCCDCCDCNDCGGDGGLPMAILMILLAIAVALVVLGMLVVFWCVIANVLYGTWLNQSLMRDGIAYRYKVLPYDPDTDHETGKVEEQSPQASPGARAQDAQVPQQEVMSALPNELP